MGPVVKRWGCGQSCNERAWQAGIHRAVGRAGKERIEVGGVRKLIPMGWRWSGSWEEWRRQDGEE